MDKLQLVRPTKVNKIRKPFGIYTDTYDILKKLSDESGVPMVQIMHEMVIFSLKNVELVDSIEDLDDLKNVKWGLR